YKTPQEAVDAAELGDLIELYPEAFGDASVGTVLKLKATHDFQGTCPTYTVIRPVGYAENFKKGVRVSPADASKMATLIGGSNDSSPYAHVVRIEDYGSADLTAVNVATNVLTTRAPHGFNPGDELVWSRKPGTPYEWLDGGDFSHTRRYWVLTTPTPTTMTLSETPGGPSVDITAQPSPGHLFLATLRKASATIACWKLQ